MRELYERTSRPLTRPVRRYRWLAAVYDLDPGQKFLYARARTRAAELLRLSPGSAVLDVDCGTGRNFPLVEAHIGNAGSSESTSRWRC